MARLPHKLFYVAAALGLFGCTGPDNTVNRLLPDIFVAPDAVDFGEVVVLYSETETVQLGNAGRAPLSVSNIYVDGDTKGVYTIEPTSIELERDDSTPISITFAPATYVDYDLDLVFESDDEDTPELRVPLSGKGVDGPVPDIQVDKGSLDFGTVAQGEDESDWFTIKNVGDGPLTIDRMDFQGSGNFSIITDPGGQTLENEGDSFTVIVEYAPTHDEGDSATFTIFSNDPDEAEVEVLLLGNGGGDFEYPVAIIDCPSESIDPPDTVDLDGTDSYDPSGYEPLLYTWSVLEQPTGSVSDIDDAEAGFTSVFVDSAGLWKVQLSVENTQGIKGAPETCTFTALPEDQLHVELTWDSSQSDFDLHLVEEDGAFHDATTDCCWCNKNPSWGESGSADDPLLALDDRAGFGPENIKLFAPADGDFKVYVHYFTDGGAGTSFATLKVFIDGVEKDRQSMAMGHDDLWEVGIARFPDATFVASEDTSDDLLPAPSRKCK